MAVKLDKGFYKHPNKAANECFRYVIPFPPGRCQSSRGR